MPGVHGSRAAAATYEQEARRQLQRLAVEGVRREREGTALRLREDGMRLGCVSVMRAGPIGAAPLAFTAPLP